MLHDNALLRPPVEPLRDIVCPKHHRSSLPYLLSSRPTVQLYDQHTCVMWVDCRGQVMPKRGE
jgi:hypothetical protein